MNRLAWIAVLVAIGAIVLTNTSFRRRQITRGWSELVEGGDRFVDIGVDLVVVRQDPNGQELIEGKPKLAVVRRHSFGDVRDSNSATFAYAGPSRDPRVWYCSEEQEQIILHPDSEPLGQLVYGSEGAGKTFCGVMWVYLRWLSMLSERREIGVTAPTSTRISIVLQAMLDMYPRSWFNYQSSTGILTFRDGTRCRLVSTYRQSKAQGSPIQGFGWSSCLRDEGQDQVDVHEDIEARGRSAAGGRYKQLITATAKDDPEWRTLRDQLDAANSNGTALWVRRTLFGRRSPFIPASFWDAKRSTMSPREYSRRVDAKDVGPERATYPNWSRETNLIVLPEIGSGLTDVTAHELGPNYSMLVGHDPGTLWDVSLFLKAYVRNLAAYHKKIERPTWIVLGELNTQQSTTEVHIAKLLEYVRREHRLNLLTPNGKPNPNANQILMRADPAGETENRTHKSIYTQFANAGIRIKPAAYNADNDGHGKVPKDPGIEVINTLICDADGRRRLFVARKPDGSPAAPKLVASIEASERDLLGKAETQRKDMGDISHWPAALRYALWAIERPRLQLLPKEDV